MGKVTRMVVAIALACLGLGGAAQMAAAETTVQGSQTTDGAASESGTTSGTNANSFRGGPAGTGSSSAGAQQLGSNRGTASQDGTAKSGDSVAGAQVTGAVADDVTVQNQNSSTGASAETGESSITNLYGEEARELGLMFSDPTGLGPVALSLNGSAQASQLGSNTLDVVQTASASTGDAVAGSQVTGIVGGGEHTVQLQNDADDGALTLSGDAVVNNLASATVGPLAASPDNASVSQIGDNDAVISQSGEVSSGDALFGAQVTGVVGGSATVQGQNSSTGGSTATSGDADVFNVVTPGFGDAIVGPQASSDSTAQATQNGDNALEISQATAGSTGDALSGAQVTGGVGDQGGFLTVQNQQVSDGDTAESGDFDSQNFVDGTVGPVAVATDTAAVSQLGDNAAAIAQSTDGSTGDALAGSQVTGAVGYTDVTVQNQNDAEGSFDRSFSPSAESGDIQGGCSKCISALGTPFDGDINESNISVGPVGSAGSDASAAQIGDNALSIAQAAELSTGDAVAGGQITGVVADGPGANIDVQNQNSALGMASLTGDINADDINQIEAFDEDSLAGPIADSGGSARATQNGDNAVAIAQAVDATTGDAVAGGQVTGIVAGRNADVNVQNQNTAEDTDAVSGDGNISSFNDIEDEVGPSADGSDSGTASQLGDNTADFSQAAVFASGDAVSGSQISGVVAGSGSEVTLQVQNDALEADAESGSLDDSGDLHDIDSSVGPFAFGDDLAQVEQIGDNDLAVDQSLDVATGDAVGGSQVSGVVAGDGSDVDVQAQNTADDSDATSGSIDSEEGGANDADLSAGPAGQSSDVVSAAQIGDNTVAVAQSAAVATGDAVGGAQVNGVVAGDNSDVTVQGQNSAASIGENSAESGNVYFTDPVNQVDPDGALLAGPSADSEQGTTAQATQNGDNAVTIAQAADLATGDAVNGSQVSGVVAGAHSTIEVQEQNTCGVGGTCGTAESGSIEMDEETNEVDGEIGPEAISGTTASSSQLGDNVLSVEQALVAASGDAVSGSQVTGAVAGHGSETTVQNQNASQAATAISGDVTGLENDVDAVVGPFAGAPTAQAEQIGDDVAAIEQDAAVSSGDAVAGSQVTGTVGGDATVQNGNSSVDPDADSGAASDIENNIEGSAGPSAEGDTAQANQVGGTDSATSQGLTTQSGDAVAGSQIGGSVAA